MRSLEDHLSPRELATLPSSPEGLAESTRDIAQHLIECDACAQLAQTHWSLRNMGHPLSGNQPACPPEDVWLEYAAGLIPERANELLAHAASCADCAHALREAMELMEPEAAELPEDLASATPAWQHSLAERMAASAPKPFLVKTTRRVRPWVVFGAAAAVLLATVFTGITLYRNAHSDTRLLALAYDKHRLSELRIPGSLDSPLASPTRGHNPYADTSSSELFEVKLRAQQAFERNPNDPVLRQTLGRIAIVEHDGETARRQFEMAEALNPNLPNLKFDLATAYFVLAESGNKPLDYARAIDLFGQHLALVHQQDPVALFDQGLCWERQNIDSQAIKDYEAALALEKDPGWRKEIGQHLQALKARDTPTGVSALKPDELTPASFLALTSETPGEYELYLDAASRLWLPHRADPNPPPGTDAALHELAAMGLRHGDAWLTDMLKQPATSAEIAAETTLGQALQASAKGNRDEALAASASAINLVRKSRNQPGFIRAHAEHVYGLQRMGRSKDCLAEATQLVTNGEVEQYAWQRVNLDLEISSCNALKGGIGVGLQMATDASDLADYHHLANLRLRASSFLISYWFLQGHIQPAWSAATSNLALCNTLPGSGYRRAELIYDLGDMAKSLNLPWTQMGLASASAKAATMGGDLQTAAYAYEELGLTELHVRADGDAAHSFENADTILAQLGKGPTTTFYSADWKTDRATLIASQRGPAAAVKVLADQENVLGKQDTFLVTRLHFYTEYATLLRESNQPRDSFEKARIATEDAEQMLPAIHTERERLAWAEAARPAYDLMTLDLADTTQPEASLRSWQWFHSAAFRSKYTPSGGASANDIVARFPEVQTVPSGTLILIYARMQDRYVAWSIANDDREPIRFRKLTTPADAIDERSREFTRLCEDPHSSQQDIAILGENIYRIMLSPFEDQIARSQSIQFDLDGPLARIPLAALVHDGQFLGLQHPIQFLPPWWALAGGDAKSTIANRETLPAHSHLLIIRESATNSVARIPEQYDESRDIAALFPNTKIQAASLYRNDTGIMIDGSQTLSAELATADLVHYTGHGLDEDENRTSASEHSVEVANGSLKHCRLAVLSACRTLSIGEREEDTNDVPSFERIVLASGATHVVGTQWDVDSAMTRKLMVRFYTELANHQPFAEALRRAQLSLQSEPTTAHPYFWSAFQLVGQ